ncbi:MAG: molybdenum hydroxylase [Anaerolineaceae bacterium]|nr:MAG: molybdenum hydroxylase [Anaerolineaceae bacterium]
MRADNAILIRGGGDLASGVALRLHRAGLRVLIAELPQPLAVRRTVSFCEAVYEGSQTVEGVSARLIETHQLAAWNETNGIPVIIDPQASLLLAFRVPVVIDARLVKTPPPPLPAPVALHIGLGPGFHAGQNCHAAIETRRSHTLGRVYWDAAPQTDTGAPEGDPRRVLRAPTDGVLRSVKKIGDQCEEGELIAAVGDRTILSPFHGLLRGLIRDGLQVTKGLKIGDVDARGDVSACRLVSDKALSIGGGALEALLSQPNIRKTLYSDSVKYLS